MSKTYVGLDRMDPIRSSHAFISKRMLRDERLSAKARGILAYLFSHGRGWQVELGDLRKNGLGGETALRAAFKEMRILGYARLVALREDGVWKGSRYMVSETAAVEIQKITPSGNPHLKNSSYSLRKQEAPPRLPPDLGLNLNGTGKAMKFASKYAQFSASNRFHVGQGRHSTKTGWTKITIQNWAKSCQELFDQLDGDTSQVKEAMKWYFVHWNDPYVPRCKTVYRFVEKFSDIQRIMQKPATGDNGVHEEEDRPRAMTKEDFEYLGLPVPKGRR